MTTTLTTQDRLRIAFAPTKLGVAGLTDQILESCIDGAGEFVRVGDRVVCRWTIDGDTHEAVAPLPPAAFRTVLARIASLCRDRDVDAVTPYAGHATLTTAGTPSAIFCVTFANSPDDQHLRVRQEERADERMGISPPVFPTEVAQASLTASE